MVGATDPPATGLGDFDDAGLIDADTGAEPEICVGSMVLEKEAIGLMAPIPPPEGCTPIGAFVAAGDGDVAGDTLTAGAGDVAGATLATGDASEAGAELAGAVTTGNVFDGTAADGAVADGPMTGTVVDGTAADGEVTTGNVFEGTAADGAVTGAVVEGTAADGEVTTGAVFEGTEAGAELDGAVAGDVVLKGLNNEGGATGFLVGVADVAGPTLATGADDEGLPVTAADGVPERSIGGRKGEWVGIY